jgi:hypothetical protein
MRPLPPIVILLVLLTFTATAHAQQSVVTDPNETPKDDMELSNSPSKSMDQSTVTPVAQTKANSGLPRRVATNNLFAKVSNPFEKTTERTDPATASPKPQVVDPDEWRFQFAPYLWVAGISGNVGIGSAAVNVDAGITDSNVDLRFGFMGTFAARKNRLIILTDLQYSNLGTDHATPGPLFSTARADFKTFVLDPEVGYRLVDNPEKNASIDVLGGIRYWHLKTDITLNPGLLSAVTASRSRSWVDAVAGLRANTDITKRIFLTGKTDLGGGGSHFTYQLFGGVGLHMGRHFSLIGGYRHLSVNYNKDGFLFDTALAGPVFGLAIRF